MLNLCPPCRLEAEEFRTLPRADLLLARSRTLVKKYVASDARRAVPLSEAARDRITACCDSDMVGPGLFLEAQTQVSGRNPRQHMLIKSAL